MFKPKPKWYQDGLKFKCTQCGNCCSGAPGYVWVTKENIKAIAEFLGFEDGRLDKRYLRRVGRRFSLTEKPDGDCVFLQRDGDSSGCQIYPVRPVQCRTWPFWSSNLRSAESWATAGRTCPGMDHGQHYEFVDIEDIRLREE